MPLLLILENLRKKLFYPFVYAIVAFHSLKNYLRLKGKRHTVHFEHKYQGQKILLLALYEKGQLRPDIIQLLKASQQLELYIIAINTQSICDPQLLDSLINCYIERPNFGRDFGSYQLGFKHIIAKKWNITCPRLLMLNDSIFYSKKNLLPFLNELTNTDIEVLGATENHEFEHHLGSFCISINNDILQHRKFLSYWSSYSNSNIRPKVIKSGEMKLSSTLRQCVSSKNHFSARYNLCSVSEHIQSNKDLLMNLVSLYRSPAIHLPLDFSDWRRPSLKNTAERIINKYIHAEPSLHDFDREINLIKKEKVSESIFFIDDIENLIKYFMIHTKEKNLKMITDIVMQEIMNDFMECFSFGSQIHQNAIILHIIGLPIIKLDGLYRGMFSLEDVETLSNQLDQDEKLAFKNLMFSNPFGGNSLFGWKRIAFFRGLI
jgi:hypothetical protein